MASTTILLGSGVAKSSGVPPTQRVMMLGDSLTKGDTVTAGWRKEFWRLLRLDRGNVRLRGTQSFGDAVGGVLGDWRHQATAGATMVDLEAAFAGYVASVGGPDVIIDLSGTNDIAVVDAATCIARKRALLDRIASTCPSAFVLVGNPPRFFAPFADFAAATAVRDAYVALLPALVAEYGTRFRYVESCSSLTASHIGADGVHPNSAGQTIIAQEFHSAYLRLNYGTDGMIVPRSFVGRGGQASVKLVTDATDYVAITSVAAEMPADRWALRLAMRPAAMPSALRAVAQYQQPYTAGCLLAIDGSVNPKTTNVYMGGAGAVIAAQTTLAATTWAEIVMYGDRSAGVVMLFINGVLNGYATGVSAWSPTAGGSWRFGKNASFDGLPGLYDNVEVYAGSSLPGHDDIRLTVEAAYFEGTLMPGRRCRYRLNEGTGTSLADADGGAAGSLNGAGATWDTVAHPWD